MNPAPELGPQLKQLRLSGILDSLEARNREAIHSKLAYTDFLALLIGDEVARREQKKFTSRLRRAQFRTTKTLDQFDFERLPHLNRSLVHDLATGRYLSEKAPVLIVGPCGTGKSHLAQALGHCAHASIGRRSACSPPRGCPRYGWLPPVCRTPCLRAAHWPSLPGWNTKAECRRRCTRLSVQLAAPARQKSRAGQAPVFESRPQARHAAHQSTFSGCRMAQKCAVPISPAMTRRCFWPSSIPARPMMTIPTPNRQPLKLLQPAGPTSNPACHLARPCWPCPGAAAARSVSRQPSDAPLARTGGASAPGCDESTQGDISQATCTRHQTHANFDQADITFHRGHTFG